LLVKEIQAENSYSKDSLGETELGKPTSLAGAFVGIFFGDFRQMAPFRQMMVLMGSF
jgi:hypothetical protein